MLSSTLWRALTTPVTYSLVAVLVGTAIMQVRYVNRALQRFDSTQVIPVQFVMFTISVIVGSAILYRDFEKFTTENWSKFIGGCLLTFFGVWLITSGRLRQDEDEDEISDDEGQERINLVDQESADAEYQRQNGGRRRESIRRRSALSQVGDATNENDPTLDSRRSSHVSFLDPRPRTPQTYPVGRRQSPMRVVTSSIDAEDENVSEDTPLLNPWKDSTDLLRAPRRPGMQATSSSPVLLSEAQIQPTDNSQTPTVRSTSQSNFHTHPNHQQSPAPPQADYRPVTPARHSISRMMPGPLLSPLSGGLSVVVADSLRRGIESPRSGGTFRRPRLGLRKTKSGSHRLAQTPDGADDDGTDPILKPADPSSAGSMSKSLEDNDISSWSRMTRARSLSNTLGDLFRGKRQKAETSDIAGDEEVGPSDSGT